MSVCLSVGRSVGRSVGHAYKLTTHDLQLIQCKLGDLSTGTLNGIMKIDIFIALSI